jgi:hypothetical protein
MSTDDNLPPSASRLGDPLPDLSACQVSPVGISNLQYCRKPDPAGCHYFVAYGNQTYCFFPHPEKFGQPTG